ncbi:cytochrome-c oxidase, cbb3-type subunit III [Novosphingobium piscinae]|uniref:Cbb3-type cytochrome c oxidase subunit n=1 Tax=Novosphingobium piscinae TaxID=1507448 RepID=A0A7X1G135_9SPHN|nr:cytochrome-c oxidase, cbb3-type subunit III [Novosphingobium piscinae]MBC2670714.1 cytochrome-c oxidase, cbb3-type subunit III [Novosphingobium piscinae]
MAEKRLDEATGVETVGHEWDGIEELNTPLPRWWLYTFYATIVFAIGYIVVYPAVPLARSGTAGLWQWSSRGALAADTVSAERERASTLAAIAATPIAALPGNPVLMRAAIAGGKAAFRVNCVQCHGAGAAGSKGYPNLNDDDWLWGGDLQTIETTITHGIRQPGDDATRQSQMPSFGHDGILPPGEVADVASYVRSLSGKVAPGSAAAGRGAVIFANNCVACHGADGKGARQFGAPNLADAIWLYGGDQASVVASVTNAHAGVMPAWGQRLDPVTIKMLAAYVHSLGGGEKFAPGQGADPATAATAAAAAQ